MNSAPFDSDSFKILAESGARAHIIGLIPGQIVTEHLVEELKVENGQAVSDIEKDILKIAVIERHNASGNIGLGFVHGFGLKRGAIAGSVGHDSHNLIVVGTSDDDMNAAAKAVIEIGGGLVAIADGNTIASLPLLLAGLMSNATIEEVNAQMEKLKSAASSLGSEIEDPFMILGFLALPVIPKLKLTDKGLVDVEKFQIIGLFEGGLS